METLINNQIQIPSNYNLVGTCSHCGGPIIQSIIWSGTVEPTKYCMNCGRVAKKNVIPTFGPILETE